MEVFSVIVLISPIFVGLIVGFILRWFFFKDPAPWQMLNVICYWLLFPVLLFYTILTAQFEYHGLGDFLIAITIGFLISFCLAVLLCHQLKFSLPVCNSTVQGVGRHNSFVALALCGTLLGQQGLAIAILATAFQVTVTNLFVMTYVLSYTQSRAPGQASGWRWDKLILNQLKNPFLMSIALAFLVRSLGVQYIPIINESSKLLGQSALPLSLLATGAGLTLQIERGQIAPLVIGVLGKMFVFPAIVIGLSFLLQLPPSYLVVAAIYAAVPTASSSYVVARITGGDAPLLSTMTMLQIMVSFLTLTGLAVWFDGLGYLH